MKKIYREARKLGTQMNSREYGVVRGLASRCATNLTYTEHCLTRRKCKDIKEEDVRATVRSGEIVEFHLVNNSCRVLLRLHKRATNYDVCVVLDVFKGVVLTVYPNLYIDKHDTLHEELYDKDLDVIKILQECKIIK